jgi:outer membrane protein TolC
MTMLTCVLSGDRVTVAAAVRTCRFVCLALAGAACATLAGVRGAEVASGGVPEAPGARGSGLPGIASPITVQAAQAVALRDNPGLAAAAARVRAAAAAYRQARSAFAPTITLGGDVSYTRDTPAAQGGEGLEPFEAYGVDASLSWLLFDGFAREAQVLAARHGERASGQGYSDAQRLLLRAVSAAFNQVLFATENVRISREDADFNNELAEEVAKRLAVGAASRSELLNFRIRATAAEDRLLEFQRDERLARIALAELMGLRQAGRMQDVELAFPGDVSPELPDLAAEVEGALGRRPDVLAQRETVALQAANVRAAQGQFWPTVAVQASYGESRVDNPRFNDDRDALAFLGVAATWDIFTGGRVAASVDQARAELRAAELALQGAEIAVAAAVRSEYETLASAQQRLALQRRIREMTAESKELVLKEYLAGKSSLTRLNEAQTDLVRAEGALVLARLRVVQAVENLAAATGRILDKARGGE